MGWFDATSFGIIMTAIMGLYAYMYKMERRVTRIETILFNFNKAEIKAKVKEEENGETQKAQEVG